MTKLRLIICAILVLLASPALADYVVRDGNNALKTIKSFTFGGAIVPQVTPTDSAGAAFGTSGNPFYTAPPNGKAGNFGRSTATVCIAPTVTNGTYGQGVVVGGLLTFPSLFTSAGSGTIQNVSINFTTAQTVSFLLYPFGGSPTNASTWTDHSAAAISGSTDIFLARSPISFVVPNSSLGTMTNYSVQGLGQSYSTGSTNGYFVLVPMGTTASLGGTSNVVQVCVTVQQDQ